MKILRSKLPFLFLFTILFASMCSLNLNYPSIIFHSTQMEMQSFVNSPQSQQLLENAQNKPLDTENIATQYNLTGSNVTIAFMDTGVNISHECFNRFQGTIPFYNVYQPELGLQYGNPGNTSGHGTHVISIALGNCSDFQGIAPQANILMIDIFNQSNPTATDPSSVILGFNWLLNYTMTHPVNILSLSIGMPNSDPSAPILASYVHNFTQRGIIVIAAAGNNGVVGGQTVLSPGISPDAITVGAINSQDLTIYSGSGQGPGQNNSIKPDIVAPGVNELGASNSVADLYFAQTGTCRSRSLRFGIMCIVASILSFP